MSRDAVVGLKVDCDTYEGSRRGIPALLDLLASLQIKGTFFFVLGPDRSGRAVARVFRQRGFLKKMLRSNAASLYGPKTMLYGTLLPAPMVGRKLEEELRSVAQAGHEVGIHSWDHVAWHDRLDRMSESEIASQYGKAHAEFERIFGRRARCSAAAGWHATQSSLRVEKGYDLAFTSNTRGPHPFFPEANGESFETLEIPTTLPTWDEVPSTEERLVEDYLPLLTGIQVHTIHTEVEGGARLPLFAKLLEQAIDRGVRFVPLGTLAEKALVTPSRIPRRKLVRITLPGRGGFVTSSREAA